MKVKCRGYEGELIALLANEPTIYDGKGNTHYLSVERYDITLRGKHGAKIELSNVGQEEIEEESL